MNFPTKLVIAVCLTLLGIIDGFMKIRQYVKYPKHALKEDLMDLLISLPRLLWSALLIIVGVGWLHYLLTSG